MATADGPATWAADPIVPDGCVELVVNLGDPFVRVTPAGPERQPLLLLAGQMTTPTTVKPTGRVDLLGIRLRSASAPLLFGHEAWALRDRLIDANDWLGRPVRRLAERLAGAPGPDARLQVLAAHLQVGSGHQTTTGRLASWAADRIRSRGGRVSVDRLSQEAGVQRRQLERAFRQWVGLTPKELARIARVQRALGIFRREPSATGADVAARCGYADQPHLIREFRALVGTSPGGVAAGDAGLGGALRGPHAGMG